MSCRECVIVVATLLFFSACGPLHADDMGKELMTHAQSDYLESCGGCHGLQGISANGLVPMLRDRAGYWMCTTKGREYVVRLPNVAFAARTDEELADLLNFVVFSLGGSSASKVAKPYTAEEVGRLRSGASPLITGLRKARREVIAAMRRSCSFPAEFARPAIGY